MDYNRLVEKKANEIIDNALEKEAYDARKKETKETKGIRLVQRGLGGAALGAGLAIPPQILAQIIAAKSKGKAPNIMGLGAGLGAAHGLIGAYKKNVRRDQAHKDYVATHDVAEKAAEVLEDGIAKMAAAEEVYENSVAEIDAAVEILEELGIDINELIGE